jgi:hypothetical protein
MSITRKEKLNILLKVNHLEPKTRKAINKDIYKLGDYHDGIPISDIRDIMEKHHMVLLQEDNTEYSAIFCGRDGVAHIRFGYKSTAQEVNGLPTFIPFDNSLIVMTWHKMTHKYEVIMYIS